MFFLDVKQYENIFKCKRGQPAKHLASLKAPNSAGCINTACSQQVWVNLEPFQTLVNLAAFKSKVCINLLNSKKKAKVSDKMSIWSHLIPVKGCKWSAEVRILVVVQQTLHWEHFSAYTWRVNDKYMEVLGCSRKTSYKMMIYLKLGFWLSCSPHPQIVPASCQEVRVDSLQW